NGYRRGGRKREESAREPGASSAAGGTATWTSAPSGAGGASTGSAATPHAIPDAAAMGQEAGSEGEWLRCPSGAEVSWASEECAAPASCAAAVRAGDPSMPMQATAHASPTSEEVSATSASSAARSRKRILMTYNIP